MPTNDRTAQLTDLPVAPLSQVRKQLGQLFKTHRLTFIAVAVSYLLMGTFMAALPRVVSMMTDRAAAGQEFAQYQHLLVWAVACAIAAGVTAALARVFSGWLGAAIAHDARYRFVHHANRVPLGLVERIGAGQLIARVTDDVNRVAQTCNSSLLMFANASVLVVATTAQVLFGTGWLGLAAVPMVIIWVVVSCNYLAHSTRAYLRIARTDAEIAATITETTRAAETVDALSLGPWRLQVLGDGLKRMWVAQRYGAWLRVNYVPYLTGAVLLTSALTVLGAAWLVPAGSASVEQASLSLTSTALLFPFARMCGMRVDEVQLGLVSYARLLGLECLSESDHGHRTAQFHGGGVELTDVSFSYRPQVPVLKGVSLSIRSGESVAIVGPSGCGKSTVARLIARLSPAGSGQVIVAGVDVAAVTPQQIRQQVVLLTQEQHVFCTSLADNLRLAAPDATDDDLCTAMAAVGAQAWLDSLPHGLATIVGDGGVAVGPAEGQQVALARAVLARPRILILDEATSLFDPDTAEAAETKLRSALGDCTIISIAHQLHTALLADRVVMMESGVVTEVGPHDQLMAAGRGYADLFRAWSMGTGRVTSMGTGRDTN